MITLQQLCSFLDEFLLCCDFTDDYGPNGLQVEGREMIDRVGLAVSASLEVIQKAVEEKVQVLIAHHGLFWKGDNPKIAGAKKKRLKALLDNDISLLAYHLPLDASKEVGNNWLAAKRLGLAELVEFGDFKGRKIGVKGRLSPTDIHEWREKLEKFYGHKAYVALGGKEKVESAAILSGGGYRYLREAVECGADCFVTGNFDEPAWHMAFEERINFFALGHDATEKIGPRALGKLISERFGLRAIFIDSGNPF